MIIDARDSNVKLTRSTLVAIVGAGPAGMTLAKELAHFASVLLIESGGLEADAKIQALYEGDSVGIDYPLTETRARQFGGSSALWNGYCAHFDSHDFEPRSWVPMSGWPFREDVLQPYYTRAAAMLNLGDASFDAQVVARGAGLAAPFESAEITTSVWRYGNPILRFGEHLRDEFAENCNITVLMHANVVELRLDAEHSSVTELVVRTLDGREGRIAAKLVVMACGGIETPRLLLNSNRQIPRGVANESGFVGRCFMEHPHVPVSSLILNNDTLRKGWAERGIGDDGREFMFALGVSSQMQKETRILNARAHVYRTPHMHKDEGPRLGIFLEQAPNPDSRLTLAPSVDALGLRRVQLDWRLTDLDWKSFEETARLLGHALGRAGASRFVDSKKPTVPRDNSAVLYTHHHIGTARMSENKTEGVVNSNCRVHDLSNLYIASSAVYPTASWANPTFTLVCLVLRLANHLRSVVRF